MIFQLALQEKPTLSGGLRTTRVKKGPREVTYDDFDEACVPQVRVIGISNIILNNTIIRYCNEEEETSSV